MSNTLSNTKHELIYVAAPYAHPDAKIVQSRMTSLYSVMNIFSQRGLHVITPLFMHEIVIRHAMKDDYAYWEQYCLNMLKRCDAMYVILLDGWAASRGVAEEIEFCVKHAIPVTYYRENGDIVDWSTC